MGIYSRVSTVRMKLKAVGREARLDLLTIPKKEEEDG
jgi:hypothetical protein